jgi:hypothetical protein
MPLDSKGGFHLHPGAAKMSDGFHAAKPIEAGKVGDKGHVELHHGPAPDGKGKFHTIHHPGGEARGHDTMHEAHHAMNEHMGQDGCTGDGNCEHSGSEAGSQPEGAAVSGTDDEY